MAKQSIITAIGTIAAVDYSTQISAMTVSTSVEELATECFSDTAKRREGGLKDGSVSITFKPNADLTNYATISALLGTVVAITFKADVASTSATNPELQANALVTQAPDWGGTQGGLLEASVTWPLDTVVTYATS